MNYQRRIRVKKSVLIFGISGFVGKYLTKEFENAGYLVFGADTNSSGELHNIPFYKTDLLDVKSVENLLEKFTPDIIVNLAAISSVGLSWRIPADTIMVNVVGSLNILEAAKKKSKNSKILFVGSSEEYDRTEKRISETSKLDAGNPYGISKIMQEQFAKIYRDQYGLNIYCVRSFNHTGVGQKETFVLSDFCRQAAQISKSGKPGKIKVGNISVKRDFGHVKDMVRAYRMILESGDSKKIYNVGYGKAYGLDELLNYIISLSKQKIKIEVDESRIRPVDNPVICCDNSLLKKELGWKSYYTVFDALNEMFEDYKNKV